MPLVSRLRLKAPPPMRAARPCCCVPVLASLALAKARQSVFWLLVVGIVFARAVYFEPGAFSFDRAVAWAQGLFAFL